MTRRFAAVLGALALSLAGLVGVAGPAHAYTSENGVCETGELCMWQDSWTHRGRYDTGRTTANFNVKAFVAGCPADCSLNDNVSSLRNKDSRHYVRMWEHANFSGGLFTRKWANGTDELDAAMDLTIDKFTNGLAVNDRISSFCFVYETHPNTQCRGTSR